MSLLRRLLGTPLPEDLAAALDRGEHVVGAAVTDSGEQVAVTALGLWIPSEDGPRRISWHLISKAAWADGVLAVTEADEVSHAGDAVVIADRAPRRVRLTEPRRVPKLIRQRVDGSIRSRYYKELPGGGAWFVVRKVPGRDGVVLQVRPDPGTDPDAVAAIASEAAGKMAEGQD